MCLSQYLQSPIRMHAPINMMMVCAKSVHMTAVSPPVMVKIVAIAKRIRMDKYNPASPSRPRACLMKMAPEKRSAFDPGANDKQKNDC